MKIVDRKTFLAMPEGVVFSKYEPCVFGPLEIKGETWGEAGDFWAQQIADGVAGDLDALLRAKESDESISFDFNCQYRDGLHDADQLFAAWEPADIQALIVRLQQSLKESGHA